MVKHFKGILVGAFWGFLLWLLKLCCKTNVIGQEVLCKPAVFTAFSLSKHYVVLVLNFWGQWLSTVYIWFVLYYHPYTWIHSKIKLYILHMGTRYTVEFSKSPYWISMTIVTALELTNLSHIMYFRLVDLHNIIYFMLFGSLLNISVKFYPEKHGVK